jgi:hypothetical protein
MTVAEKRLVEASVGLDVPTETMHRRSQGQDQSIEGLLRVSSEMTAILIGPGFKITALTPEQQAVAEGSPTVWAWEIEARQHGEQELQATLYALLSTDDKLRSLRLRIDSFSQKINVSVKDQTWDEWLKSVRDQIDAAKAIIVAISSGVVAVLGWLGFLFNRRRTSKKKLQGKTLRKAAQ